MPDRLKLAVMVTESPTSDERGTVARRLLAAAHQAGHQIGCVFFYYDGAYTVLPGDTHNRWRQLARSSGFRLIACVASAERRGITREAAEGFELQGLTHWLDEALAADRVLRF